MKQLLLLGLVFLVFLAMPVSAYYSSITYVSGDFTNSQNAFNGNWGDNTGAKSAPGYLIGDAGDSFVLTDFEVYFLGDQTFNIQGSSSSGGPWTTLGTYTTTGSSGVYDRIISISGANAYRYYKYNMVTCSYFTNVCWIGELGFNLVEPVYNLTINANANNFTVEVDGFGNYSTTSGSVTTDIVMDQSRTLHLSFYDATNGTTNIPFYDRNYYFQSFNETVYIFTATLYSSDPSPLTLVSPINDSIHNSPITFVANASAYESDVGGFVSCYLYTNESGSWDIKETNLFGSTTFSSQTFSNGEYIWNVMCRDEAFNAIWSNTNYTIIWDDIEPIINYIYPDSNNGTFTDEDFNFSLQITDKNNYVTWVNVTYPNGSIMYTNEFNTTGTTIANLTGYLNPSVSVTGYYLMNVTAADGHTARLIESYDLKKVNKEIRIKDIEETKIYAKNKDAFYTPETTKKKDRYEFEFTKTAVEKSKGKNKFIPDTFVVETTGEIEVVKDSKYKGHMIIRDGDITNWKWVDFETEEGYPVEVRIVGKNKVEVDVYGYGNYKFKSIGDLNVRTKIVQYYYDGNAFNATLIYDPVIVNNLTYEYKIDYTLNPLIFTNLPAPMGSLNLNGTLYSGTVDSYTATTGSILTNAAIPISGEKTTINGNWTVNFYHVNGSSVTRTTSNFSQLVYNVTIGLCGGTQIFPIYNLTYYAEKTDAAINLTNGYDLSFYDGVYYYNISGTFIDDYSNQFCTNVNSSDTTYNFDTTGTLTLSKTGYVTRYYNFEDGTSFISSNNPTTYKKYYLLSLGNSTSVAYTWLTTEFQNINGLMEISKCNNNGTKSVVSIVPIVGGSAVANIDYVDTRYSYSVYVDGVKYSEESFTPCHVESSLTPTYYVQISQVNPLPVTGLKSVTCSMDKLDDSTARMTWNSNPYNTETIEGCLVGYLASFKGPVEVYRNCTNSISYSLTRTIPDIGNQYYIKGELTQGTSTATCSPVLEYYTENSGNEIFGLEALLGVVFLILAMALFYAGDAEISVVGSILGLLAIFFLGISTLSWELVSSIVFFAVIIVIIGRYGRQ